jgi:Domain of unknown function (DUF3883)
MAPLENLTRGTSVKGILPNGLVTVIDVKWIGTVAVELTYKDSAGNLGNELLYRDREPTLEIAVEGRPWSFDGDGAMFRLRRLSPLPPVTLGAAIIVPLGLLRRLQGTASSAPPTFASDTERSEQLAMQAVMEAERRLGFQPRDVSAQKLGYDIESTIVGTGRLRFLEVKGRVAGARTVTVTKNEILTALNKPDDFLLAIVELNDGAVRSARYVRQPFQCEPDFGVTSVNYDLGELLARSEEPA